MVGLLSAANAGPVAMTSKARAKRQARMGDPPDDIR
jgi:hypothetical protein